VNRQFADRRGIEKPPQEENGSHAGMTAARSRGGMQLMMIIVVFLDILKKQGTSMTLSTAV
jgi:hypothetical protein